MHEFGMTTFALIGRWAEGGEWIRKDNNCECKNETRREKARKSNRDDKYKGQDEDKYKDQDQVEDQDQDEDQGKDRQDQTRIDKTRQDKARQDKTRQHYRTGLNAKWGRRATRARLAGRLLP
jgi:hypothetical protein